MNTVAKCRSSCARPSRAMQRRARCAFTLLEVVLALGLAVIVIALIGNSVNSTLKFIDRGREKTERDQLARAILSRIANDVRGVVRYEPFDPSGMMSVKSSSKSSKGGSKGGSTGSKGGGGGGTGKGGGTGGETGGGGGSTSGGTSASSSSSSSSSSSDEASTATPPPIAGVYGDQYNLQVDVGRLPHVYEYAAQNSGMTNTSAPPSDVRTVSYYMADASGTLGGTGLVRSELDRSAALFTTSQGGTPESEGAAAIVAPEIVAIDFQYFDGTSWAFSWDSSASSGLPQSVKITIALTTLSASADAATVASVADAATQDPDSVYSVVVLLPARDPVTPTAPAASSSSSGGGSSSSGSSSSTSGTTK